jgi:hypothetical protein
MYTTLFRLTDCRNLQGRDQRKQKTAAPPGAARTLCVRHAKQCPRDKGQKLGNAGEGSAANGIIGECFRRPQWSCV